MSPSGNRTANRCIALFGATLAILTSLSLNIGYAIEIGSAHSSFHAAAFAVGATAATLLAASLPSIFLPALGRLNLIQASAGVVLWIAAVAFSCLAAIGASSLSRSEFAGQRSADAAGHERLTAEYKQLAAARDSLVAGRSSAELAPLIQSKVAATRGANCADWTPSTAIRAACLDLGKLQAEDARSARRQAITVELKVITDKLETEPAAKAADPQAEALAAYLRAVGFKLKSDQIGPWLSLAVALFFELASALGFIAAGTLAPAIKEKTPATIEQVDQPGASPILASLPVSVSLAEPLPADATNTVRSVHPVPPPKQPVAMRTAGASALQDRIRDEVVSAGGTINFSQRGIALKLCTSPASVNRAIAALVASGTLVAAMGNAGTTLRVA